MAWLLRSPFGRTLIAIRENERRARFLGIPVDQHIWLSWVISCAFVSLAGTLYALLNNFVDPRALHWTQSGDFVIMAVLGGMRSFWGPLIGAAIFVVLQDYLSSMTENWMSFIGLFFVLVVLFFPRGVLGMIRRKVHVMSLLQVENVSKHFGSLVAVDDVSMTVEPGELRAVIGPNGAGKTTFFNMISGFLRRRRAASCSTARTSSQLAPAPPGLARHGAHLPDHRGLSRAVGRRESARSGRGRRRLPPAPLAVARRRRRNSCAASPSCWRWAGSPTRPTGWSANSSHGDQRATEIMMALALKPRLLLLDEPTAGMGDQETYDITRLIRKLHREQKLTIVLIEHDMRVVFHLADRIMVLAEGEMLAEGTPQEIAANEAVQAAYLGKAAA